MGNVHIAARKGATIWSLAAAAALLALVQFAILPAQPKILSVLNNFAHGPVFAALAIVLLGWLRPRFIPSPWSAYAGAFVLAVAAGGALEVLQIFTRRDASLADIVTNALGAGCGLTLAAAFDRAFRPARSGARRRLLLLAAGLQLFVMLVPVGHALLAYATRMERFPTIMRFTSVLDMYFIDLRDCEKASEDAGEPALRVRCHGNDWPGISNIEPSPDWRQFERLRIDVTNPGAGGLTLGLRIHEIGKDQEYDDRYNGEFFIGAGARRVFDVKLEDIASSPADRRLDLSRIGGLVLFRVSPGPQVAEFILTRVWLE